MTEGKMADRASKSRPPPPPLAQGLDPPLRTRSEMSVNSMIELEFGNVGFIAVTR